MCFVPQTCEFCLLSFPNLVCDVKILHGWGDWWEENIEHFDTYILNSFEGWFGIEKKTLAERGFDPRTSGLWAQHASTAPLCYSYFLPDKPDHTTSTSRLTSSSSSSETEKAARLSRQFSFTDSKFKQLKEMVFLTTLPKLLFLSLLFSRGAPPFAQGQVRTKLDFLLG